jgi:hypothetical protein
MLETTGFCVLTVILELTLGWCEFIKIMSKETLLSLTIFSKLTHLRLYGFLFLLSDCYESLTSSGHILFFRFIIVLETAFFAFRTGVLKTTNERGIFINCVSEGARATRRISA